MTVSPMPCECCGEEIPAGSIFGIDKAIGTVCFDCMEALDGVPAALLQAGMERIYLSPCPDND